MRKFNLHNRLTLLVVPVLLFVPILVLTSCSSAVPKELSDSKKLWEDQKLTDYDFTLERQCFCPEDWRGPVNIEVRNGTVESVTYVSDGTEVTDGKFDEADTIDKLFAILEHAYEGSGDFNQKAARIDVTYDDEMGYPVSLYIDVSQQIADEEQGYTVTNFAAR